LGHSRYIQRNFELLYFYLILDMSVIVSNRTSCFDFEDDPYDYAYRPSKYQGASISQEEYAVHDKWAAALYSNSVVMSRNDSDDEDENLYVKQSAAQIDGKVSRIYELASGCFDGFTDLDKSVFRSHVIDKQGYMIALLAMIPEITCRETDLYYHFNDGVDDYKCEIEHVRVFYYLYDSDEPKANIAFKIDSFLYEGMTCTYDFKVPLSVRRGCKVKSRFDNGQAKIFLSALRAFDKIMPGPCTVLVLGSASHPVKSGYAYHSLAQFLTLSGCSGTFHLFDPTEKHNDCTIGAFNLIYKNVEFKFGSKYYINGFPPDVILDDIYTNDNKTIQDLDPDGTILKNHPTSRVSCKFPPGAKKWKVHNIHSQVFNQHYYHGNEQRISYNCPNWTYKRGTVNNHCCETCFYYASLISRIGFPSEDVTQYWKILWTIVGQHCNAVSGIRNMMLLSMLRHELIRGHNRESAMGNVMNEIEGRLKVTEKGLSRLIQFEAKRDPLFKQCLEVYAPNGDLNMEIRNKVTAVEVSEFLTSQVVLLCPVKTSRYDTVKYSKIVELVQLSVGDKQLPSCNVALRCRVPGKVKEDLVFVDEYDSAINQEYKVLVRCSEYALVAHWSRYSTYRNLFDRGKDDDMGF